ncbi:MAG: L-lactate MFS transporter [Planctomycetota bacterium]|jgi:OFA family oxalate/formate antiporter-like MFS transporter
MTNGVAAAASAPENHGWRVTFAGMGINLALGILYTWSIISRGIPDDWGWTQSDKQLPYAMACLIFSLVMVPAGRMQDKISPRFVATIGGILVGAGMIIASFTTSPLGYMLGFGVLAGAGIGFGYASATPPAVKWFSPAKTGLIAGIVVSGFGLASAYAAPLSEFLIRTVGVGNTVLMLGVAFLVIVAGLAQILKPPPARYVPAGVSPQKAADGLQRKEEYLPKEMLRTWQFFAIWFMYACGAGAGLMIISVAKKIVAAEVTEAMAVAAVMGLAVGNGGGRVVAGVVSDKLGRKVTLFIFFVLQAVLLFLLTKAHGDSILASGPALIIMAALIGANYGSNLSLFPSITKDYFGIKNFGMNYGLVFTAWGVGGFMLAKVAGMLYDKYESFNTAYFGAAGLLILAALMVLFIRQPHHTSEANAEPATRQLEVGPSS